MAGRLEQKYSSDSWSCFVQWLYIVFPFLHAIVFRPTAFINPAFIGQHTVEWKNAHINRNVSVDYLLNLQLLYNCFIQLDIWYFPYILKLIHCDVSMHHCVIEWRVVIRTSEEVCHQAQIKLFRWLQVKP